MYNFTNLLFLITTFCLIMPFCYISFPRNEKKHCRELYSCCYFFLITVLFIIIITRDFSNLPDQTEYIRYFNTYLHERDSVLKNLVLIEPSFKILSILVKLIFNENVFVLFLLYSIIGYCSKVLEIYKLRNENRFCFLTLFIYSSYYLILQDFIQIRVAASMAFFLRAVDCKIYNYRKRCLLFLMLSFFFHYSAIVGFIILFVSDKHWNIKLYMYGLVIVFCIALLRINVISILSYLPLGSISVKIEVYRNYKGTNLVNIFSFSKIVRYTILLMLIILHKRIQWKSFSIIFAKLYYFSIFFQLLFSTVPVIPTRVSEFFRLSEIFVLPFFITCIKEKKVIISFIIIYCIYSFYYTIEEYLL